MHRKKTGAAGYGKNGGNRNSEFWKDTEYDMPMQEEYGLEEKMALVRQWYDGFVFGCHGEIYNPWSILNYLKIQKVSAYWANTSGNRLVGKLIQEGNKDTKLIMEGLLRGESFHAQIVYDQLDEDEAAIWSLFLASGYLKILKFEQHMTEFGH